MPFTLAHAAAALPLRRTKLIQSAVVIGCFVPDFEYFVRLAPRAGGGHTFSHTLPGLFLIDLPLGIAAFWLFHRYSKVTLWAWLPKAIRERVEQGPRTLHFKSVAEAMLVLASILVGAATHILWDSFCHTSYWPYRHLHFLDRSLMFPFWGSVPLHSALQVGSSVFGTLVVLIWIGYQMKHSPINLRSIDRAHSQLREDLAFVCSVALIGGALRAMHGLRPPEASHRFSVFIAEAAITVITLFLIQSIIFGFLHEKARSPAPTI